MAAQTHLWTNRFALKEPNLLSVYFSLITVTSACCSVHTCKCVAVLCLGKCPHPGQEQVGCFTRTAALTLNKRADKRGAWSRARIHKLNFGSPVSMDAAQRWKNRKGRGGVFGYFFSCLFIPSLWRLFPFLLIIQVYFLNVVDKHRSVCDSRGTQFTVFKQKNVQLYHDITELKNKFLLYVSFFFF